MLTDSAAVNTLGLLRLAALAPGGGAVCDTRRGGRAARLRAGPGPARRAWTSIALRTGVRVARRGPGRVRRGPRSSAPGRCAARCTWSPPRTSRGCCRSAPPARSPPPRCAARGSASPTRRSSGPGRSRSRSCAAAGAGPGPSSSRAGPRPGSTSRSSRGYHTLGRPLSARTALSRGPSHGPKEQAFVLLDEWVPEPRRLGREEALAEWARRFFRSHGPAGRKDFARWTGHPRRRRDHRDRRRPRRPRRDRRPAARPGDPRAARRRPTTPAASCSCPGSTSSSWATPTAPRSSTPSTPTGSARATTGCSARRSSGTARSSGPGRGRAAGRTVGWSASRSDGADSAVVTSSAVRSPKSIDLPVVPVGALLDGAARRFGDRPALIHHDEAVTFRELWAEACGVAHALVARGIRPGDVVGLHLPNVLVWPIAYHGILLAGATVALASPALPGRAAARPARGRGRRRRRHPRHHPAQRDRHRRPAPRPRRSATRRRPARRRDRPHRRARPPRLHRRHHRPVEGRRADARGRRRERPAVRRELRGRRARPRRARRRSPSSRSRRPRSTRSGSARRVSIAVAPWFHAMGTNGLTIGLVTGATAVVQDRFDPAAYLADVERHRATTLSGAPAMYHALLAHPDARTRDLTSVRSVTSGASPMAVAQAERIAALMPDAIVLEGYGLTEATMALCTSPSERSAHRRIGTVGLPIANTEVAAARPSRAGGPGDEPVAVGERGRDVGAGPAGDGALPRAARGDRRRRWSTAGCAPATSGSSATTACSRSSTGPRTCCSTRATTSSRASSRSASPGARRCARLAVVGLPDEAVGRAADGGRGPRPRRRRRTRWPRWPPR